MGKNWDYARLSQMAKRHKGPENLIKSIERSNYIKGFAAGKAAQHPKMVAIGVGGLLIGVVASKIKDLFTNSNEPNSSEILNAEETAAIEQELIAGIEQYNAESEARVTSESLEPVPSEDEPQFVDKNYELESHEPTESYKQTDDEGTI